MPMVVHDARSKYCNIKTCDAARQHVDEGIVISGFVEKRQTSSRSVDNVEDEARGDAARATRHARTERNVDAVLDVRPRCPL